MKMKMKTKVHVEQVEDECIKQVENECVDPVGDDDVITKTKVLNK